MHSDDKAIFLKIILHIELFVYKILHNCILEYIRIFDIQVCENDYYYLY